jgi:hypothetical protein
MEAIQEQTTLKQDLDVIIKEGLEIFEPGAPEGDGQALLGPAKTDEGKIVEDEAAKTKAAEEAARVAAEAAKTAAFRFTTHDEAEKGYKESQKVITSLSEKNKALELEAQNLRTAEARKKEEATATANFTEFSTNRNFQALEEIDKLDPDQPDYKKNVAAAWARAHVDIRNYVPAAPAPVIAAPAPVITAEVAAPVIKQEDMNAIRNYTRTVISKPENGGFQPDDILFWSIASHAPSKDDKGEPIALDDQIKWALDQTNKYLSAKGKGMSEAERVAAANKIATERAKTEMPLGRSGAERAAAVNNEEDKPLSLSDAVTQSLEMRRL